MRLKIVTPRHRVQCRKYFWTFSSKSTPGAGFSFETDAQYNLTTTDHWDNLSELQAYFEKICKDPDLEGPFKDESQWSYVDPAVGLCSCGGYVQLSDPLDNECDRCDRWYNMSGQEVLDPNSESGREARAQDDMYADDNYSHLATRPEHRFD